MKAIVCELCGSQSLTKKDDVYVCESCGTKYTAEEAKRLLVEVAVKQDNTERLENNYLLARRARENNDSKSARQHYEAVLADDPTSWEAAFYSIYYRSATCVVRDIQSACRDVANCLDSVFYLIKNNEPEEKQKDAVTQVATSCIVIGKAMYKAALNHYTSIDISIRGKYVEEYSNRVFAALKIMFVCGECIEKRFADNDDIIKLAAVPTKEALDIINSGYKGFSAEYVSKKIDMVDKYIPGYKHQVEMAKANARATNKGCVLMLLSLVLIVGGLIACNFSFTIGIPLIAVGVIAILIIRSINLNLGEKKKKTIRFFVRSRKKTKKKRIRINNNCCHQDHFTQNIKNQPDRSNGRVLCCLFLKKLCRQISVSRIGQEDDDVFALVFGGFCKRDGGVECRAR